MDLNDAACFSLNIIVLYIALLGNGRTGNLGTLEIGAFGVLLMIGWLSFLAMDVLGWHGPF